MGRLGGGKRRKEEDEYGRGGGGEGEWGGECGGGMGMEGR